MNWDAIAFDWNQIRGFWAAAEEGSFSAGARALGLTQPTLGRQVAALEASLGVTLFERTGRALHLTQAGQTLLEHTRAMGEAAHRLSLAASGAAQDVSGLVRISAADMVCVHTLPPVLADLRRAAPGVQIDLHASNDLSDIAHREADIALRHVRPTEPDLIARLLRENGVRFYASPGYLDTYGRPARAADLAAHSLISFGPPEPLLRLLAPDVALTPAHLRTTSNSGIAAWEMVRQGMGIMLMFDDIAQMSGGVEPVLPEWEVLRVPTWLVTHRELHTARRIRLVFDHLADALSGPSRA